MKKSVMMQLLVLTAALFSVTAHGDAAAVKKSITEAMRGAAPDAVNPSEVPGLYEVFLGPKLFYMSEDGRYLIQGKVIDIVAKKDVTEPKLAKARHSAIEKVGKDQMVIFKADKPKYTVSVFTDIDCGYCRKLHSEIDQYLAEGITIQYLFFPRAGIGSSSYDKAVAVWCSDNRNEAMTKAKRGEDPPIKTCENPVEEHMALGTALGATGTPMLVSEAGTVFPGYMPAKQLANFLEMEKSGQQ